MFQKDELKLSEDNVYKFSAPGARGQRHPLLASGGQQQGAVEPPLAPPLGQTSGQEGPLGKTRGPLGKEGFKGPQAIQVYRLLHIQSSSKCII